MRKILATMLFAATAIAAPLVTFTVVPVLGPNAHASSRYAAFADATLDAFEAGVPGATPSLTIADLLTTDYPSWRGVANPLAPYAEEYGAFLYFALRIVAQDTTFSLAQLSVTQSSTDPWNYFGYAATIVRDTYAADAIGVIHDGSGTRHVTSGTADQQVDELLYIGLAAALDASTYYGYTADQSGLDAALRDYQALGTFTITTCYALDGETGCGSAAVVPEPAPWMLAAGALPGLLLFVRRRPRVAGRKR